MAGVSSVSLELTKSDASETSTTGAPTLTLQGGSNASSEIYGGSSSRVHTFRDTDVLDSVAEGVECDDEISF